MDQLAELENRLAADFVVHRLNFSGHGGAPFTEPNFSIPLFAKEVIRFLDEKKIEQIPVFGYSMGGYVAMYLANHYPLRVHKVITLATKFHWNTAIADAEINMLQADKIEEKLPAFAGHLQKRHAPNDWKIVLEKTAAMLFDMGGNNPLQAGDYALIHHPVLLMIGDRDDMVSLDETVMVFDQLPHAQLAVLPNTAHPIEKVNIERLARELKLFIA